jgi:hypothetical protein
MRSLKLEQFSFSSITVAQDVPQVTVVQPPMRIAALHLCKMRRFFFPSQRRQARLGTRAFLLSLILLFCLLAWTQVASPPSTPTVSQPEVPQDTLGRTTPRGTVLGYLTAIHNGNNELAAQYLNTRLRGKAAADLAYQLSAVLECQLPARLNELSDKPEGSLSDSLNPDQELRGTILSGDRNVGSASWSVSSPLEFRLLFRRRLFSWPPLPPWRKQEWRGWSKRPYRVGKPITRRPNPRESGLMNVHTNMLFLTHKGAFFRQVGDASTATYCKNRRTAFFAPGGQRPTVELRPLVQTTAPHVRRHGKKSMYMTASL